MPETPYTREFYLGRAEECPYLQRVIAGECSFTETLDTLFDIYWPRDRGWTELFTKYCLALKDGALAEPAADFVVRYRSGSATYDEEDEYYPFKLIIEAAAITDSLIRRAFVVDDFFGNRELFERTYGMLDGEERENVRGELHRALDAGAIDLSELGLESYLAGIVTPAP